MAEEKFNWRLTAVWWTVLFVGAMYLMIVTAMEKTIVIADSDYGQERAGDKYAVRQRLSLKAVESEEDVFLIPLEEGTKAGNVVVENLYLEHELRIFIGGADAKFYESHAVWGDVRSILEADRETQQSGVLLCFRMDSVYEFQTSMEGNRLKIKANKPKDLYPVIVIVDPAECVHQMNGEAENNSEELTLAICRILTERWDVEGVKLYFTRTEDRKTTDEERIALSEDVEADFYIRLDTARDEDATLYGIRGCYNKEYFIPNFGNVELADILTRNVTIATDNRAMGLVEAETDSVLYRLQIPAAIVELGYMSNVQENMLMDQESYRQNLATGVMEAVREVYTIYYEQDIQ